MEASKSCFHPLAWPLNRFLAVHGSGRQVTHCSGAYTIECPFGRKNSIYTIYERHLQEAPKSFGFWGVLSISCFFVLVLHEWNEEVALGGENQISVAPIHAHVLGPYGPVPAGTLNKRTHTYCQSSEEHACSIMLYLDAGSITGQVAFQ